MVEVNKGDLVIRTKSVRNGKPSRYEQKEGALFRSIGKGIDTVYYTSIHSTKDFRLTNKLEQCVFEDGIFNMNDLVWKLPSKSSFAVNITNDNGFITHDGLNKYKQACITMGFGEQRSNFGDTNYVGYRGKEAKTWTHKPRLVDKVFKSSNEFMRYAYDYWAMPKEMSKPSAKPKKIVNKDLTAKLIENLTVDFIDNLNISMKHYSPSILDIKPIEPHKLSVKIPELPVEGYHKGVYDPLVDFLVKSSRLNIGSKISKGSKGIWWTSYRWGYIYTTVHLKHYLTHEINTFLGRESKLEDLLDKFPIKGGEDFTWDLIGQPIKFPTEGIFTGSLEERNIISSYLYTTDRAKMSFTAGYTTSIVWKEDVWYKSDGETKIYHDGKSFIETPYTFDYLKLLISKLKQHNNNLNDNKNGKENLFRENRRTARRKNNRARQFAGRTKPNSTSERHPEQQKRGFKETSRNRRTARSSGPKLNSNLRC